MPHPSASRPGRPKPPDLTLAAISLPEQRTQPDPAADDLSAEAPGTTLHPETVVLPETLTLPETLLLPEKPAFPAAVAVPRIREVATPWLTGCHVLLLGVDHEPDGPGYAPASLAIAEHLATVAESVTVLTAVAHRPTWSLRERVRRSRAARATATTAISPSERRGADGPRVVRLDYNVAANQTGITRAAYEATRLASAASAACPAPPGLVIATTPSLGGVVAAARVARRNDAPLVVVVNDLLARSGGSPGAVASALEQHALTSADVVAVMDEAFHEPVAAYGIAPERIHVVPAWAPFQRSPLGRRQARAELGWATRGCVVVLAGDMGLRQDVGNVVEAARLLADRHDVRFVLVGDGSQRRLLEDQARGLASVRFKDLPDGDALPVALAAADVLLVNERPATGDATSVGMLAGCLGAGRPVVAAVNPGGPAAREAVRTRGAVVVVPPGDPVALAGAVRTLASEPQLRLTMADRALDHARTSLAYRSSMRVVDDVVEAALTHRW